MPFVPNRVCDNIRLTQKMDCRLQTCWSTDYYDQNDSPPLNENEYSLTDDNGPVTIQIVEKPNQPYCNEEPNPGLIGCYGQKEQWYFNATEGKCAKFKFTGCGGNKNNFDTEDECLEVCHPNGPNKRFNSLKSLSLVREDYLAEQPQQTIQTGPQPIDCQVDKI